MYSRPSFSPLVKGCSAPQPPRAHSGAFAASSAAPCSCTRAASLRGAHLSPPSIPPMLISGTRSSGAVMRHTTWRPTAAAIPARAEGSGGAPPAALMFRGARMPAVVRLIPRCLVRMVVMRRGRNRLRWRPKKSSADGHGGFLKENRDPGAAPQSDRAWRSARPPERARRAVWNRWPATSPSRWR